MPIKLPEEITYFYEITRMADRLYYCIPKKQLHLMVREGSVQKKIVEDYPDGVDIKVSLMQFKEFEEDYGMTFNIDPELIWKAFQLVKLKTKKGHFGTGFIQRQFLEGVVFQIQSDSNQAMLAPLKKDQDRIAIDLAPSAIKDQKRFQRKKQLSEKKMYKRLKRLSIKDIDLNKSIIEQSFSKVKMSDGDEPFDFLSRYYQKQKKGK